MFTVICFNIIYIDIRKLMKALIMLQIDTKILTFHAEILEKFAIHGYFLNMMSIQRQTTMPVKDIQ